MARKNNKIQPALANLSGTTTPSRACCIFDSELVF